MAVVSFQQCQQTDRAHGLGEDKASEGRHQKPDETFKGHGPAHPVTRVMQIGRSTSNMHDGDKMQGAEGLDSLPTMMIEQRFTRVRCVVWVPACVCSGLQQTHSYDSNHRHHRQRHPPYRPDAI